MVKANTMHVQLVPTCQFDSDEIVRVNQFPFRIGRAHENDLCLPSDFVSRVHCELFKASGRLFVRDLESRNGTLVNGRYVDGIFELLSGCMLTVGPNQFEIRVEARIERPVFLSQRSGLFDRRPTAQGA